MKVYPYKRLAGEVTFQVTSVRQEREGGYQHDLETWAFSAQERVVALHRVERDDWESVRLGISATLPAKELDAGPWSDVTALAVLTEKATNSRTTAVLKCGPSGLWTGHLRFWRSAYRSRAELTVVVVATVDAVRGRMVGEARDPWLVDLTARVPARQREMLVNQVDFNTGPEWLRPFRDAPWLVETSGDLPTVHLNAGFEGITELLDSSGGPLERAVRDMLAAQIATDVWTAVFHSAVSDLEVDEHGSPLWPGGWRDAVLRGMLADVLPDHSEADALREIHARRRESSGWNELQPRINYAAVRRAKVARNLGTAIRTLDVSQRGSKE
ncbi:hypothetical protein [Streptomyces mirabilis]|uniref:hypothetical protein n=1 Tax=Streptomyces mirabilis TaxID=68239 RepID=UPI00225AAD65|nr:hypothetical protein [Streptomyces mirabilis]MCX4609091.1 hypothetical protein [Streptomyces mirabilis]